MNDDGSIHHMIFADFSSDRPVMNGPTDSYKMNSQLGMQSYPFVTPNGGFNGDKKNYVFVDEHNRHKRLKVMRACEGCRKRKIKCDGATTSSWPCGSCTRLKQKCNPPVVNLDRAVAGGGHVSGLERVLNFDDDTGSDEEDEYAYGANAMYQPSNNPDNLGIIHQPYGTSFESFNTPPYTDSNVDFHDSGYQELGPIPLDLSHSSYQDPTSFAPPLSASLAPSEHSNPSWSNEQYAQTTADLSDALGELKIPDNGVAPYIADQKRQLAETPAYEEPETKLPASYTTSGSVRIPPALMPSDQQCRELFKIFFSEVHPYVPVISRPYFEQQWNHNRSSISPLILEAIFACAGRMSDDASEGASWLALAYRHEDCFMDVPRLSTIQALLLLLKARESAPKRGYYYRSWMTVKKLVSMAHDLELDQHYKLHQTPGLKCNSDPTECLVKTRIWQNIFMCEIMIGGPQGRRDMGVDPSTVDLEIHRPSPGIEHTDYQISRQFTYLVRKVYNVRIMHDLKGNAKDPAQKDWVADPKFVNISSDLSKWLDELPRDMQVDFPDDDAPPFLSSHFIGNMHSYYHLTVIMLHRPQLMHPSAYTDGSWKHHLSVCYESSKKMCKLQEAILRNFGIPGLLCMQRGINFVIYAVLTCTMVHLVAVTSPDPDFNRDSKEYFTRHMRILETCTTAWPQPEMQAQIDALRDAFSADTSRPFQLKPNFPSGGSPFASGFQPSPPLETSAFQQPSMSRHPSFSIAPTSYPTQPITPPVSAGLHNPRDGQMPSVSNSVLSSGLHSLPMTSMAMQDGCDQWNPTPIFQTYNNAFGPNSASMMALNSTQPQQSPPLFPPSSIMPTMQGAMPLQPQQHNYPMQQNMPAMQRNNSVSQMAAAFGNSTPSGASANMWADSVAQTLKSGGVKRRWDSNVSSAYMTDSSHSKRPR